MKNKISIIQLNDMHISSKDIFRNGANIKKNFLTALNKVKTIPHDFIVLNGDLGYDVCDHDYDWLKKQMSGLNYFVVPGNHDITSETAKYFGMKNSLVDGKIFYEKKYKGKRFVFADTSEEYLDIDVLKRFIDNGSPQGGTFVFMHHPPSLCDSRHMDTYYPLGNHEKAREFFNNCPQVDHVFCAHYHTDHHVKNESFTVHICPSTWYQIGRKPKKFNIRHSKPGYGLIDIGEDVTVRYYFIK
ncbi:MAG: metallophosphoesterase [Candidatus Delongbacteria bacterium]